MFSLSQDREQDLTQGVLELVGRYLEAREQTPPRLLGLITAQQVKDDLGIKAKTVTRWEDNG
ncbi:XRE family transcriptional regulator, partial [Streptococcus suis]